jgi:hypothetical protein
LQTSIEGGTAIVLAYLLVSMGVIIAFLLAAFVIGWFIGRLRQRRREEQQPEPKKPMTCWFCSEPASDERFVVAQSYEGSRQHGRCICETCIAKASAIVAAHRQGSGP